MKFRLLCPVIIAVMLLLGTLNAFAQMEIQRNFTYNQGDGSVDVLRDGQLVTRYIYKDTPRPYFYPLLTPGGLAITRNYPMQKAPAEPTDHPHHRSFWLGYGDVNGIDFWTEGPKSGKIVQTSIDFKPISPGYWGIHTSNDWIGPDGKKVCQDERNTIFLSCKYGTLVSSLIRITAISRDITLNDTKEGFFAIRLAPSMALKGGKGHILNSEGDKDAAAWGKRARWVDYTGEVNGKPCGVTMFDAPDNYGYPTYWHARDYGLLAANPFGGATFTNDQKNDSSRTVGYRKSILLRYVTLIHDGKLDSKTIDSIADSVVSRPAPPEEDRGNGMHRMGSDRPKPAEPEQAKPAENKQLKPATDE